MGVLYTRTLCYATLPTWNRFYATVMYEIILLHCYLDVASNVIKKLLVVQHVKVCPLIVMIVIITREIHQNYMNRKKLLHFFRNFLIKIINNDENTWTTVRLNNNSIDLFVLYIWFQRTTSPVQVQETIRESIKDR